MATLPPLSAALTQRPNSVAGHVGAQPTPTYTSPSAASAPVSRVHSHELHYGGGGGGMPPSSSGSSSGGGGAYANLIATGQVGSRWRFPLPPPQQQQSQGGSSETHSASLPTQPASGRQPLVPPVRAPTIVSARDAAAVAAAPLSQPASVAVAPSLPNSLGANRAGSRPPSAKGKSASPPRQSFLPPLLGPNPPTTASAPGGSSAEEAAAAPGATHVPRAPAARPPSQKATSAGPTPQEVNQSSTTTTTTTVASPEVPAAPERRASSRNGSARRRTATQQGADAPTDGSAICSTEALHLQSASSQRPANATVPPVVSPTDEILVSVAEAPRSGRIAPPADALNATAPAQTGSQVPVPPQPLASSSTASVGGVPPELYAALQAQVASISHLLLTLQRQQHEAGAAGAAASDAQLRSPRAAAGDSGDVAKVHSDDTPHHGATGAAHITPFRAPLDMHDSADAGARTTMTSLYAVSPPSSLATTTTTATLVNGNSIAEGVVARHALTQPSSADATPAVPPTTSPSHLPLAAAGVSPTLEGPAIIGTAERIDGGNDARRRSSRIPPLIFSPAPHAASPRTLVATSTSASAVLAEHLFAARSQLLMQTECSQRAMLERDGALDLLEVYAQRHTAHASRRLQHSMAAPVAPPATTTAVAAPVHVLHHSTVAATSASTDSSTPAHAAGSATAAPSAPPPPPLPLDAEIMAAAAAFHMLGGGGISGPTSGMRHLQSGDLSPIPVAARPDSEMPGVSPSLPGDSRHQSHARGADATAATAAMIAVAAQVVYSDATPITHQREQLPQPDEFAFHAYQLAHASSLPSPQGPSAGLAASTTAPQPHVAQIAAATIPVEAFSHVVLRVVGAKFSRDAAEGELLLVELAGGEDAWVPAARVADQPAVVEYYALQRTGATNALLSATGTFFGGTSLEGAVMEPPEVAHAHHINHHHIFHQLGPTNAVVNAADGGYSAFRPSDARPPSDGGATDVSRRGRRRSSPAVEGGALGWSERAELAAELAALRPQQRFSMDDLDETGVAEELAGPLCRSRSDSSSPQPVRTNAQRDVGGVPSGEDCGDPAAATDGSTLPCVPAIEMNDVQPSPPGRLAGPTGAPVTGTQAIVETTALHDDTKALSTVSGDAAPPRRRPSTSLPPMTTAGPAVPAVATTPNDFNAAPAVAPAITAQDEAGASSPATAVPPIAGAAGAGAVAQHAASASARSESGACPSARTSAVTATDAVLLDQLHSGLAAAEAERRARRQRREELHARAFARIDHLTPRDTTSGTQGVQDGATTVAVVAAAAAPLPPAPEPPAPEAPASKAATPESASAGGAMPATATKAPATLGDGVIGATLPPPSPSSHRALYAEAAATSAAATPALKRAGISSRGRSPIDVASPLRVVFNEVVHFVAPPVPSQSETAASCDSQVASARSHNHEIRNGAPHAPTASAASAAPPNDSAVTCGQEGEAIAVRAGRVGAGSAEVGTSTTPSARGSGGDAVPRQRAPPRVETGRLDDRERSRKGASRYGPEMSHGLLSASHLD